MADPLARFEAKYIPEPNSGCWLWDGQIMHMGYGSFWMNGTTMRAHRVSWLLHKGAIPVTMNVLHRCDVRSCVNPDHLFLGTTQDNSDDMVSKGRAAQQKGEDHGMSKLTEEDIRKVFRLRDSGLLHREIAEIIGTCKQHVGDILSRRRWAHVDV